MAKIPPPTPESLRARLAAQWAQSRTTTVPKVELLPHVLALLARLERLEKRVEELEARL